MALASPLNRPRGASVTVRSTGARSIAHRPPLHHKLTPTHKRMVAPSSARDSLPAHQTAALVNKPGGPEAIEVVTDAPVPSPGPDDVLIRVKFAGVNYLDTYQRAGLYPVALPFTLGADGAGVVVALGANVANLPLQAAKLQVGDNVGFISRKGGAYAQFISVPASTVAKIPDDLDLATATAAFIQGITALVLVNHAYNTQPGDWLLVPAAAGGTGQLVTQVAAQKGAHVIALVSTPEKAALAKSLGAEHALLSGSASDDDLVKQIIELSGGGVHASIDGVGAATWDVSRKSLRLSGSLLSFGGASGRVPPVDLATIAPKATKVSRPSIFEYIGATPSGFEDFANEALSLISSGKLKVQAPTVYQLSESSKAHEDLQGRKTTGKLVIAIPE